MEARDHHYGSRTHCFCVISVCQHGQAGCGRSGRYHSDRRHALYGVHSLDCSALLALNQERNDKSPKNIKDFENLWSVT